MGPSLVLRSSIRSSDRAVARLGRIATGGILLFPAPCLRSASSRVIRTKPMNTRVTGLDAMEGNVWSMATATIGGFHQRAVFGEGQGAESSGWRDSHLARKALAGSSCG